jgi:hypothetical protein
MDLGIGFHRFVTRPGSLVSCGLTPHEMIPLKLGSNYVFEPKAIFPLEAKERSPA